MSTVGRVEQLMEMGHFHKAMAVLDTSGNIDEEQRPSDIGMTRIHKLTIGQDIFVYFADMPYILYESGLHCTLRESLYLGRGAYVENEEVRRRRRRYRHECAWRLAQWDDDYDDEGEDDDGGDASLAYVRNRSRALRHLVRDEEDDGDGGYKRAVSSARKALCSLLRSGGSAACAMFSSLGKFRALTEMEFLRELARDPSELKLRKVMEVWEERDRHCDARFQHIEETFLQRFVVHHLLPSILFPQALRRIVFADASSWKCSTFL